MKPEVKRYDTSKWFSEEISPNELSDFSKNSFQSRVAPNNVEPAIFSKHDLPGFALSIRHKANSALRATL